VGSGRRKKRTNKAKRGTFAKVGRQVVVAILFNKKLASGKNLEQARPEEGIGQETGS